MTDPATLRGREQEATAFGVAELVFLARLGGLEPGAATLHALGVPPEMLAEDVVECGASTLVAREMLVEDAPGDWSAAGDAIPVAYGLSHAIRWVTLSFQSSGGRLDGALVVASDRVRLIVVPRTLETYRIAGLDDDGDLAEGILDMIVSELEHEPGSTAMASFEDGREERPRTIVVRQATPEGIAAMGLDAEANLECRYLVSDGIVVEGEMPDFRGLVDADGLAERIGAALRLDEHELLAPEDEPGPDGDAAGAASDAEEARR